MRHHTSDPKSLRTSISAYGSYVIAAINKEADKFTQTGTVHLRRVVLLLNQHVCESIKRRVAPTSSLHEWSEERVAVNAYLAPS